MISIVKIKFHKERNQIRETIMVKLDPYLKVLFEWDEIGKRGQRESLILFKYFFIVSYPICSNFLFIICNFLTGFYFKCKITQTC